jgi:quercetin dioxygenase-like cupin family protein
VWLFFQVGFQVNLRNTFLPNDKKKEFMMNENIEISKGVAFNSKDHIAYADGSVVSKTLLKKEIGNITLFSFDSGQGLSEHTAPFDAFVYIR